MLGMTRARHAFVCDGIENLERGNDQFAMFLVTVSSLGVDLDPCYLGSLRILRGAPHRHSGGSFYIRGDGMIRVKRCDTIKGLLPCRRTTFHRQRRARMRPTPE